VTAELRIDPTARFSARLSKGARDCLAARVRELSAGQHSQRGLAAATGLGIGTVRDIWSGSSDPTLSTLLALTEALGVHSIEELLGPIGTQRLLELQRDAVVSRTA
jgi:transcriptional regulator with XRE-family HTH domain